MKRFTEDVVFTALLLVSCVGSGILSYWVVARLLAAIRTICQ